LQPCACSGEVHAQCCPQCPPLPSHGTTEIGDREVTS
jgi:hypothetical protein